MEQWLRAAEVFLHAFLLKSSSLSREASGFILEYLRPLSTLSTHRVQGQQLWLLLGPLFTF